MNRKLAINLIFPTKTSVEKVRKQIGDYCVMLGMVVLAIVQSGGYHTMSIAGIGLNSCLLFTGTTNTENATQYAKSIGLHGSMAKCAAKSTTASAWGTLNNCNRM